MSNFSRSKGNQTVICVQLIECNMRNIFVEKSYPKCCGETVPRTFLKNQIWAYFWINRLKFYVVCFYWWQVEGYRNILKLSWRPLAFTSYKAFLKNRKRSGISLRTSFSAWFLKKNLSLVIFYELTKFYCLVAFTSWDLGQYVYCSCLLTSFWCFYC